MRQDLNGSWGKVAGRRRIAPPDVPSKEESSCGETEALCVLADGAAALFAAAFAQAGPIDSPLPMLSGQPSLVLYIIPGVTKNNNLETEVICTNLDAVDGRVGVEIFAPAGGSPLNDVAGGDGDQLVYAGGTVTIGTSNAIGFHEDEVIVGLPQNVKEGRFYRMLARGKALRLGGVLGSSRSVSK